MTDRISIKYGEFYDFPRMIRFQMGKEWFFLQSVFDDEKDDYPDAYEVYLLPFHAEEDFQSNPNYFMELGNAAYLGQIPIANIGLDETRRRTIDGGAFEHWLSIRGKA